MHTHLLTPLAPLVLRTGKPFGDTGGDDSHTFPLPSTVAGALRTAHADAQKLNFLEEKTRILDWVSHGALPAELGIEKVMPMFHRPADSRYAKSDDKLVLQRLAPEPLEEGEGCDLLDGLLLVFLEEDDKSKSAPGPVWWTETAMHTWLQGRTPDPDELGAEPIPISTRSHVALEPATLASRTGQLFQSSGPDFEARRSEPKSDFTKRGWADKRYGLLARFSQELDPGLIRLGGETRLANVTPCDAWPRLPDSLMAALETAQRIRLILATPALFSGGWKPGWIKENLIGSPPGIPDLVLQLRAAAVDRWLPISGWDMAARKAKAVRRLVPAGAVYWFDVIGKAPAGWVEALWLSSISDNENKQDCKDGFGLVLPGIWKQEKTS
ncbi:MAG: type III-B CRISPR module-associated Cmr3 family protein [Sulfuricella sp.]